jgi:beta-lactamase superfamily II metal-dependent hydrolase
VNLSRPASLVLDVLPAQEGDALLLACRGRDRLHHALIDAGTPSTAPAVLQRLRAIPGGVLDLLVVTHIDSDHIGGVVKLLADSSFDLKIGDAWFNGHKHLPDVQRPRGVADAERLTAVLTGNAGIQRRIPWNAAFAGDAVVRPDDLPDGSGVAGPLPVIEFPWGLKLTILSPTRRALANLRNDWQKYLDALHRGLPSPQTRQPVRIATRGLVRLEDIAARKTNDDSAPPNGSSIAFLAEFDGRSLLFAADAHPKVLIPALRALARERGRSSSSAKPLQVDVFKLPHHGSRANVTLELFDLVKARHYITSTSGRRFKHPDEEAMARVITKGRPSARVTPTLWFNYATPTTSPWMDPALAERYRFRVAAPVAGSTGVSIRLGD